MSIVFSPHGSYGHLRIRMMMGIRDTTESDCICLLVCVETYDTACNVAGNIAPSRIPCCISSCRW